MLHGDAKEDGTRHGKQHACRASILGKITNYPLPRSIAVVQITPLNHKTRHSSPPTMQTGRITHLDPIHGGFGLRGTPVSILFIKNRWAPPVSLSLIYLFSPSSDGAARRVSLFLLFQTARRRRRRRRRRGGEASGGGGGGEATAARRATEAEEARRRRRQRRRGGEASDGSGGGEAAAGAEEVQQRGEWRGRRRHSGEASDGSGGGETVGAEEARRSPSRHAPPPRLAQPSRLAPPVATEPHPPAASPPLLPRLLHRRAHLLAATSSPRQPPCRRLASPRRYLRRCLLCRAVVAV
ncbi:hypothetical protein [Oryza sativa (japonica cultivar-group)]